MKEALDGLVRQFENCDNIPQAIAHAQFPIANIPCSKWSLCNRLIVSFAGTHDARGFQQWKEVNRFVKKGSKGVSILVPWMKKQEEKKEDADKLLVGFIAKPVFKVEDTEGEALDYMQLELPELPLMDKAKKWGVNVKAVPANGYSYGSFNQIRNEIKLASDDEFVFFHELSHFADSQVRKDLKGGQQADQEIIAEFSALVLCAIVGKSPKNFVGNGYHYIESYSKKLGLSPHAGVLKFLSEISRVLNFILED